MESYHYLLNFLNVIPINITESPTNYTKVLIVASVILLIISTIISTAEYAYRNLKPSDLETIASKNKKKALLIGKQLDSHEWLWSTFIAVKTIVNVCAALAIWTVSMPDELFNNPSIGIFILKIIVTAFFVLIFSELIPRSFSSAQRIRIALLMIYPLKICSFLSKPFAYILVTTADTSNLRSHNRNDLIEQLTQTLDVTSQELPEEKEILEGIVKFGNINASEIMTPRANVINIDAESDFSKVIEIIIETGYSRIPIYKETPDNVTGILYVKDLLPYLNQTTDHDWTKVIRPAYFVPETKKINDLLAEFKTKKLHMAIVLDEYGGTAGIITLEDVLEEIVGEISDETDEEENTYSYLPDGSIIFEAQTILEDFYKIANVNAKDFKLVEGDAETLAGLLLEISGTIPQKNDIIDYGIYKFTILSADNRRIKKIKLHNIAV